MTVYADLIFFAEFFGDFLCLTLAGSIAAPVSLPRRIFAAGLGAVYGVLAALPGMWLLHTMAAKAAVCALLAAAAFAPCDRRTLLRGAVCFVLSSMLLSGGAQLLAVRGGIFPLAAALLGVACITLCALSALRGRIFARYIPCILRLGKKNVHTCGFYDSGNKLYADSDGRRVIVADERILKRFFGDGVTAANMSEFADTVEVSYGGVNAGTLRGIRLDCAYVGARRYNDVILAVSGKKIEDRVILHSTMV